MLLKSQLISKVNLVLYAGSNRHCNICNRDSRAFLPFGVDRRSDASCPMCGSLERHRLVIQFLQEKTDLFQGAVRRFLHVAPERAFVKIFAAAVGDGYLTGDISGKGVMEKMDITDIRHPENSFDAIYCSHVLEHVPNDRVAIKEFYRTLKPGGWAILNVPITAENTIEDPSVTSPTERLRLFGQEDHVRRYGPDYQDRLAEAGFDVNRYCPDDLFSAADLEKFGLANGYAGEIYFCTKG